MHNRKKGDQKTDSTKKLVLSKSQLDRITQKTDSESDLEQMVCKTVIPKKWQPLKFFSPFSTGWPDRIFLTPTGLTIWVEFKKPGGKYKRLQELNRSWLVRHDHIYFCLDTRDKCRWFIEKIVPLTLVNY